MIEQSTAPARTSVAPAPSPSSAATRISMRCPHCQAIAKARTSREISPVFKEIRYQCTNVAQDPPCGHVFIANLMIERTLIMSGRPNPRINLPIAPPRRPATKAAPSQAANDDVAT